MATKNNLVIIGGFEGSYTIESVLRDEAFIAIPGERNLSCQYKNSPSLDENTNFYNQNELCLFVGTPIGDFAVIMCSDFLELRTLGVWTLDKRLPDIVFVVARNKQFNLYKSFAQADACRIYCFVAVCNVLDSEDKETATNEGSFVIGPRREKHKNDDITDYGVPIEVKCNDYLNKITIHEISFDAIIRARKRGKPETGSGYLAIPQSAKRL